MNSALIIGGRGFLGKHLVADLLETEPEVNKIRVFDLSPCLVNVENERVEHVRGSIEDMDSLVVAMQSMDVVFHCASPPYDLMDSALFYRVNVDGTRNVIKACQQAGVKVREIQQCANYCTR
jgi:nucleoside-diphosphate-sugar epimerase